MMSMLRVVELILMVGLIGEISDLILIFKDTFSELIKVG